MYGLGVSAPPEYHENNNKLTIESEPKDLKWFSTYVNSIVSSPKEGDLEGSKSKNKKSKRNAGNYLDLNIRETVEGH